MNEHLQIVTALLKRTSFKDWLAFLIIIASYAFFYLLLKIAMPVPNRDVVMIAAGVMFGTVTTVVSFYFGSSKDKSDADRAYSIRKVAEAGTGNTVVTLLESMDVEGLKNKYLEVFGEAAPDLDKAQLIEMLKKKL